MLVDEESKRPLLRLYDGNGLIRARIGLTDDRRRTSATQTRNGHRVGD